MNGNIELLTSLVSAGVLPFVIGWLMSPPRAVNEWGRDLMADFERVQ